MKGPGINCQILQPSCGWFRIGAILALGLFILFSSVAASQKMKPVRARNQQSTDLAKLRGEFVKATRDYKVSLEKLIAINEMSLAKAETRLAQSRELYHQGLISQLDLGKSEDAVAIARDKLNDSRRQMTNADAQIAATLVEAQAEAQLAKIKVRKGSLVSTTSYLRYNGSANFLLPEAWKVQKFFFEEFKKPLPIAVFGQGGIHDRWRLDHRNAMDISLHPDGLEGQTLISFLRRNGIPFLAFRSAIPGTATGPHIHIGRPSHRF